MSGHRSFIGDFRLFFFKGLGILLPSLVTLALLLWAFNFLRNNIAEPINWTVRQAWLYAAPPILYEKALEEDQPDWYVVTSSELREEVGGEEALAELDDAERASLRTTIRRASLAKLWRDEYPALQAIGFVVAVIVVYLAGVLVGNYLGKRAYLRIEAFFVRLPVIKQVYPNVKQMVTFLLGDEESKVPATGKVVLAEWPRRGAYTVAMMTGGSLRSLAEHLGEPTATCFIPNSPTPFTGFTVNLPASDVHEIDMSFDEAIRFVVSGGVLTPPRERDNAQPSSTDNPTPELTPAPKNQSDTNPANHTDR